MSDKLTCLLPPAPEPRAVRNKHQNDSVEIPPKSLGDSPWPNTAGASGALAEEWRRAAEAKADPDVAQKTVTAMSR